MKKVNWRFVLATLAVLLGVVYVVVVGFLFDLYKLKLLLLVLGR